MIGTLLAMAQEKQRGPWITGVDSDAGVIFMAHVKNGWRIDVTFGFPEGAPVITEFQLHPEGSIVPRGGITTSVLRDKVHFTPLFDKLRESDPSRFALVAQGIDPDQDFLHIRRPGRRGRSDIFYAHWAERYVSKCAVSRRPYKDLSEEHPGFSARTIQDLIVAAKERELLVGGSQGRAGGSLTPKAIRLLEQMREGEQ